MFHSIKLEPVFRRHVACLDSLAVMKNEVDRDLLTENHLQYILIN